MTVLVVGGAGMLGRPVVEALLAAGQAVRVLGRNAASIAAAFGGRVDAVGGDVRDPGVAARAVAGVDAVHINLRASSPAEFETLEAAGAASIAAAAAREGVDRIGMLSGAGIEAGSLKLLPVRAKQAAEAALRGSGVPWTIFRATHLMESLDLVVRGKSAALIGKQPNPYHYLAATDYARMVVAAYVTPAAAGHAFTMLGPQAFTMREAMQVYIRELRPDLKLSAIPLPLMRVVAALTRKTDLAHAVVLFDAFRRLPETGDRGVADRMLGRATTTLMEWCATRRAVAKA